MTYNFSFIFISFISEPLLYQVIGIPLFIIMTTIIFYLSTFLLPSVVMILIYYGLNIFININLYYYSIFDGIVYSICLLILTVSALLFGDSNAGE